MSSTVTPAPSNTPTATAILRRSSLWLITAAAVLLFAIAYAVVQSIANSVTETEPLDAGSTGPRGAKALLAVLRDEGVAVNDTDSLARVKAAGPKSTLLVRPEAPTGLDYRKLARETTAERVVLISPNQDLLEAFAGKRIQAYTGVEGSTVIADTCDIAGLRLVKHIQGLTTGYRTTDDSSATECFRAGKGTERSATVARVSTGNREIIVIGGTGPFQNSTIAKSDNAAFALGILGRDNTLEWYSPSAGDLLEHRDPVIPAWIPPAWVLGMAALAAAAIWRGRRLGPLVIERMPVTVPANETVEGRGRLYEASGARQHALDAVRERCIRLVARRSGLGSHPAPEAIVQSVHAATGMSIADAARALYESVPTTDRDFTHTVRQVQSIARAFEPGTERSDHNDTSRNGQGKDHR